MKLLEKEGKKSITLTTEAEVNNKLIFFSGVGGDQNRVNIQH